MFQSKTNVKVMPAESNDNEPGAVNAESTREEVLKLSSLIIVLELFGFFF